MYRFYKKGIKVSKTRHILVVLLASGVVLLVAVAPASAALIHPYLSQITGTPAGPFNFQTKYPKIAVDPASGDVYVADFVEGEPGSVDIFSSSGVYQSQITSANVLGGEFYPSAVAVSDKTGDVYVASDFRVGYVYVFNVLGEYVTKITGIPSESFSESQPSIAVDQSSGDIYVADESHSAVYRFNAANEYQSTLTLPGGGRPTGVAADSSGDVYIAERSGVYEFNSSGTQILHLTGTPSGSFRDAEPIAVDSDGNIYVGDSYGNNVEAVDEFDSSGIFVNETRGAQETSDTLNGPPGGPFERVIGVAVNAAGDLYIIGGPVVDVFGPSIAVPDVSTEAATAGVSHTAEVLHGTVDPDGTEVTSCVFEYRTAAEPAYGQHSVACSSSPGSGNAPVAVSAEVSSLTPSTTYHYRVVASNARGAEGGTNYGSEVSFHVIGPPKIESVSAEVPSGKAGQTHTTLRAQIDPEGGETTYKFEYGESEAYGKSIPIPAGAIGSGEAPVPVAAELSGLKVGATYHYRVSASNEFSATPVVSADQTFTTVPAAYIDGETVSTVTAGSATLEAQINPVGDETTYYFQYGTNASYGSTMPASPGVALGSGEGDLLASVHLQGLAAGTTYHYRVVAVSEAGGETFTIEGADETFMTQSAATEIALPDGRVWEMVTPPDKGGAAIYGVGEREGNAVQAAADGGGITYGASAPFGSHQVGARSPETAQMISTRQAPDIWATEDITTPHNEGASQFSVGNRSEYKLFTSDLSLGFVQPAGNTPLPPLPAGSEKTVYLRAANGEYTPLLTSGDVPPGTAFGPPPGKEEDQAVHFQGASPDLSYVVLFSYEGVKLTENAPAGQMLYEWEDGKPEGTLKLVSVVGHSEPPATGANLGGAAGAVVRHAVSEDGSRVVWTAANGGGGLYMRDTVKEESLRLGGHEAEFETADRNDSRVFFREGRILKVFELTSGQSEPLAGGATELSGGVEGVVGASEDGSYVYFTAGNQLFLDRYEEASKTWGAPRFIASNPSKTKMEGRSLASMAARVSPNGRFLAFMSDTSVTGYDNLDANSGAPDQEVYLYDASTGRVVCASCNPTNARPVGRLEEGLTATGAPPLTDPEPLWQNEWVAANVPGWTSVNLDQALYQSRYLSDEGRLFFDSSDALVPADVNGQEDVYEYEPAGVGSCKAPGYGRSASVVFEESTGGCVGLISAGTSSVESAFLDASETGGDVFFLTESRLLPQDYDLSYDVYDAHECTASAPCAPPQALAPPPCTTGDACKPAPTPQPALYGAPSSETFSGAGNIVPEPPASPKKTVKKKTAKCARGKRLSRGRCVPQRPVKHAKKSDRTRGGK
jgi:hypothetical protein